MKYIGANKFLTWLHAKSISIEILIPNENRHFCAFNYLNPNYQPHKNNVFFARMNKDLYHFCLAKLIFYVLSHSPTVRDLHVGGLAIFLGFPYHFMFKLLCRSLKDQKLFACIALQLKFDRFLSMRLGHAIAAKSYLIHEWLEIYKHKSNIGDSVRSCYRVVTMISSFIKPREISME